MSYNISTWHSFSPPTRYKITVNICTLKRGSRKDIPHAISSFLDGEVPYSAQPGEISCDLRRAKRYSLFGNLSWLKIEITGYSRHAKPIRKSIFCDGANLHRASSRSRYRRCRGRSSRVHFLANSRYLCHHI